MYSFMFNLSLYKHSQLPHGQLSPEPSILIINQLAETLYLFFFLFMRALLRIIITLLSLYLVLLIFQVLHKY